MNPFARDTSYEDKFKIVNYVPTFNTSSKLEFNILPEKRFLNLGQTLLTFTLEIPEQFIPGKEIWLHNFDLLKLCNHF